MASSSTARSLRVSTAGVLPRVSRQRSRTRAGRKGRQLGVGSSTGAVLNYRSTGGFATVVGPWSAGVSTNSATFETWIRTTQTEQQVLFIGSNGSGGLPIISVGGDRLSVYWNAGGSASGWTSTDTSPVSDGQWHHVAVVFAAGAVTFFKDGVPTADQLSVGSAQSASGNLQLGAGFGSSTGFVGQIYNARVWSSARTAAQISDNRWAALPAGTAGMTAAVQFDQAAQNMTNLVGGGTSTPSGANIITTDLPSPTCGLQFTTPPGAGVLWPNLPAASTTALTMECWVQIPAAQAGTTRTIMLTTGVQTGEIRVIYAGGQQIGLFAQGNSAYTSIDTTAIADGTWHHIAVVFDNNFVRLFKDGVATADQLQLSATASTGLFLRAGGNSASGPGFVGSVTDLRVWSVARTAAEISSFRYVMLAGNEAHLTFLCNLKGCDPSNQSSLLAKNQVTGDVGVFPANPTAGIVAIDPPYQLLPTQVWTYQTTDGASPVGPISASGSVLAVSASTDVHNPFTDLLSIDPKTGQTIWSYDLLVQSGLDAVVVPAAITVFNGVVYVGLQSPDNAAGQYVQIQALNSSTGAAVWGKPATVAGAAALLTSPVVLNGLLFLGVNQNNAGAVAWGDPTTGVLSVNYQFPEYVGFMTEPVIDADNVYVGTVTSSGVTVSAIPASSTVGTTAAWQTPLDVEITADLVMTSGQLIVAAQNTVLALNTADGSIAWKQQVGSGTVGNRPIVIGTTVYLGSADGNVYALNAATGALQWQVDTGSAITTDLINEDGILYFANQGDGRDVAPAFYAVDTLSQGNDVLSLVIPEADTILFAQGGVSNGDVYFYGLGDVYAVNMSNVIREIGVNSKLIVENYDTTTITRSDGEPTGSDTSYRVTLTVRDEDGLVRPNQALKMWTPGTLHITNQGDGLTLDPDQPVWVETDASGALTLAVSAFDTGTPTGTPNVACPPIMLWGNFMAVGEAVVIYPDHESLVKLSTVQGPTPPANTAKGRKAAAGRRFGADGNQQYLDQAVGYDGTPMIVAGFSDSTSLTNIASTIRNTVGARNPAQVGATGLTGHRGKNKHVKAGVIPNVLYTVDDSVPTTRPYAPGSDAVFTADLSSGKVTYTTTFVGARPKALKLTTSFFSDISDFEKNVLHAGEKVATMAWKYANGAVETVIHTAESVYTLTIKTLEDAVTAVVGFLKSVVSELAKVIQWLSALFKWKNILVNHAFLKQSITNPNDKSNPGVLEQLSMWITNESTGASTNTSTVLTGISGQGTSSMNASSSGAAGQTVGQQQSAGNGDSNTVYNQGNNNNANQCTWMHQKTRENVSGATTGSSVSIVGAVMDTAGITQLLEEFLSNLKQALTGSFADLPDQIKAKMTLLLDKVKDPKSLLSAGVSDLISIFTELADDFINFSKAFATDVLTFLVGMIQQIVTFLSQSINLPFVSELYTLITGDPLSLLDLMCLVAAVPVTILLDVITGSPTVPAAAAQQNKTTSKSKPPPKAAPPAKASSATASSQPRSGVVPVPTTGAAAATPPTPAPIRPTTNTVGTPAPTSAPPTQVATTSSAATSPISIAQGTTATPIISTPIPTGQAVSGVSTTAQTPAVGEESVGSDPIAEHDLSMSHFRVDQALTDKSAQKGWLIATSIASFVVNEFNSLYDVAALDFSLTSPFTWYVDRPDGGPGFIVGTLDLISDWAGYLLGLSTNILSSVVADTPWTGAQYFYAGLGMLPIAYNTASTFASTPNPGASQALRESVLGAVDLIFASIFAKTDPAGFLGTGSDKGLTLAANVFTISSSMSEVLFVLLDPWSWAPEQVIVKVALFTVGNVLNFADNMVTVAKG